ncbi:unannotated protein [freshwater metagenome]|uniref:Unannotated protein n=1 Tax=freshwater metagenome TaxID=449393 RepID=A0A6J6EQ00_9ZZZZ|nr:copper chaperone PCu(A)C [Actinomycetota bacterium]MSY34272.1 copper chaperone PCu(A)C [Actinomycetota bacterium]
MTPRSFSRPLVFAAATLFACTAVFASACSSSGSSSSSVKQSGVVVSNASATESATSGNNGEIYFTIENTNAVVDKLFSASVPQSFAKSASVQESGASAGPATTSMNDVTSVAIPANGTVTFEPGGYHVMLTGLAAPLKAGQKFDLNLGFMNAGIIKVTVTVKAS